MAWGLFGLDYYGLMSRINRLITLALVAACIGGSAFGAAPEVEGLNNSNLDAELFYQLLVGEISVTEGDNGSAYSLMLDAARKANSPRLYERAVEIALRARSGEAALEAAQAWARAFPSSKEANRFQFQILLGLNKIAETYEPLRRELTGLAPAERASAINLLPRYFARTTDRKQAAAVVEKTLAPEMGNHTTGPSAWAAIGTMRMQAEDMDGALEAARRGVALDGAAEEPVLLAIVLMGPKTPSAEAMVRKYLAGKPTPDVRMAYARGLINAQRYAEAYAQTQVLTTKNPEFTDAWLMRGSLELQDANLVQAESSLKAYVALNPAPEDSTQTPTMGRGLVQAYLLLAQVAEQQQKLDEAKAYLDKIDSPTDALRVQRRYAGILARQGKIDAARLVIRKVPELQASDALDKINAEVQLLRDNRQFAEAYQLLQDAAARYPDDTELVYDQAMVAEKIGKPDEMENLLRKVMQAKPDYHHAYNALGYSLADRNIRLNEARQLITKALAYAPNDPFIIDSLAWVEFRSGNAPEALRLLQGAFQARPDAEIAAHLGEVLWTTGQHEQASAVWKEGVGLNPQNETLLETIQRLRGNP
jgi:tetratricopeptide (TPR) repeat protein